jgi:hypothetical protein
MPRSNRARTAVVTDARSGKCRCNPAFLVVGWILGAVGLWALVGGFATQFTSASPAAFNANVLGWYFAGLLLIGLAKMAKWKSCGTCTAHKM